MKRDETLSILRASMPGLREKFGIATLALFGSIARGEADAGSDVDLVVTFRTTPTLWDFLDARDDLAALLGAPVDLVSRTALKAHVRPRVEAEEIAV